ncbi:MAG: flagellar hook-length control protein FliK [Lachnospiraceae bacterium]|nr:flagellar hook-length control protein FliK [Lachnospiraceae bacterium]
MSFDLTGLFQRQSQIPVSDRGMSGTYTASGVQNTATAGTAGLQGANANLNLSVGQIISGQVVAVDGDVVQVEIAPGAVLQAKVEEGLALLKGMSVSFEVSGMSEKQIALRALFQNTANSATINKALEAAQLPINGETTTMVNAMMREGMPIDKDALQAMYRQVSSHPQISSEHIVTMNRLQIPITDANVKQFSDYINMEHQIRGGVETIADTMANNIAQLISEGKTDEAAQMMRQFADVFMTDGEAMTGETVLSGNPGKVLPDGDVVQQQIQSGEKVIIQDQSAPQRASLEELMRAVSEIADETAGNTETGSMSVKMQALQTEIESLGLPADKAEQFIKGELTGKELLEFTTRLLSKMAEKGSGQLQNSALAELMQKPELQNAIRQQMFSQWLMTPEDVADKQKVSDFYAKLSTQSEKLTEALKMIPGADQNLSNQLTNMNQNLDFMNQLNQTMSYVQLPLKLAGDNAHGDLYVYTNKKNLADQDGNVSAFLHLDMDHLGPVDVYVAMQQQKVSTQFYLRDDEMLSFIHENIGLLNDRLQQKGYQMNAQFSVKEKPGSVMEEIVEDHRENVKIGTFSFDMRA